MTSGASTLTLRDVADLAGVQRPVVSMWRKRPMARGKLVPFPAPVDVRAGVERFSRDDILDWLERSGRGNNDEARLDAPALGGPDGSTLETLVTLLCLRVLSGEELTESTARDRVSLAAEIDGADEFLLGEVRDAEATVDELRFVDDLVEASYGSGEALARLEGGAFGRAVGARDLNAQAVHIVRTVARACADHLDPEGVALVSGDGFTALTVALAEDFTELVIPEGDACTRAARRALRRRAAIRGVDTSSVTDGPRVRLLSIVGRDPDDALDALDDVVLDLGQGEIAVLLGPASLLCDDLRGERERKRAETLRSRTLGLALRLPRGLWREAHRQALGMWVCVGGASTSRPMVADLGGVPGPELDAGDLAADVAAALEQNSARAFRYARPHDLGAILSSHAVVPRGVRAVRVGSLDAAPHLERIQAATVVTGPPLAGFDVLVSPAPGSVLLRRRSLGELKNDQQARILRGSRIDPAHTDPEGTVLVFSAELGSDDRFPRLDPFDAATNYPRAARTEPGDVVFQGGRRPRARVDAVGGFLVASPSRILRLHRTAGVGPHTVAAIINSLPDDAGEWQTWSVPILDPEQADELEQAIVAAADYEAALRRRADAAADLVAAMIEGVAAGAVTVGTRTQQ